jgi:hypothetical protein
MYELVRRLPNTRIPIPVEASRVLKRLPPYPKLTPEHKQILFIIVSRELNPRLVLQEQSVIGASLMPAWKEGQASKLGNWSQVAALEKPVDAYTQEDRRHGRKHARKFLPLILCACKIMSMSSNRRVKFLQHLPDAEIHELSEASFSTIELQRAIEEALAQGRIGSSAST